METAVAGSCFWWEVRKDGYEKDREINHFTHYFLCFHLFLYLSFTHAVLPSLPPSQRLYFLSFVNLKTFFFMFRCAMCHVQKYSVIFTILIVNKLGPEVFSAVCVCVCKYLGSLWQLPPCP